jgi:hypothetical protein
MMFSDEITAYTFAILNTSQRIRYDHNMNDFPSGYASFETGLYGEYTKPLVYKNREKIINPNKAPLDAALIVQAL